MTDATAHDLAAEHTTPAEMRAHRESFDTFLKSAIFAVLHVGLILSCLALAFLGHASLFAVFLGVGGTLALIVAFLMFG
jgi:hypothetical protein